MPAIHLFNRKTLSGGDDLHLPALGASWLRSIQLCGLLVPIWWHLFAEAHRMGGWYHYLLYDPSNDQECRHSHLFPLMLVAYATSSTLVALVGLALELRTMQVSSWGTPTEPGNRTTKVQALLEFKLVPFSVSEGLVVLLGVTAVIGFASQYNKCASPDDGNANAASFWKDLNDMLDGDDTSAVRITATLRSWSWWWVAYAFLLLLQLIEVLVSLLYVRSLLLQPAADSSQRYSLQQQQHPPLHHELVEEMWAERCERFCECLGMSTCFFFGGRETSLGDYTDISRALADYFETGGVLDLVPSDVTAGFLVLGRIQRKRILEARHEVVSERLLDDLSSRSRDAQETSQSLSLLPGSEDEPVPSVDTDRSTGSRQRTSFLMRMEGSQTYYEAQTRQVLSRHKPRDIYTLHEGAHFVRYAHAIYTWVLYLYANPISGIPRLCCNKDRCCLCRRRGGHGEGQGLLDGSTNGFVVGDNCCQAHKSALLLHAGLDEADLVYAQLRSSFNEIPYCILLDHKWSTVVLAIRGTFSLEDCVTDVLIDPEPLDQLGEEFGFDGAGQHCHGGTLSCARILYRDLERHGILDRLLVGEDAGYPSYTLRIVGHSLGAATSTLLSFMIRDKFPTLRCINYSPPGCSLSWKLATECQEFCTSFVLDCDLVPRLSLESMEHLRDEVLGLIGRIKVPKITVANEVLRLTGFFSCRLCLDGDLENDGDNVERCLDNMLYEPDEVPQDSDYQRQLRHFRRIQSDRKLQRGQSRAIKMFPPGKIVHVIKTGERTSCTHAIANCVTCCTTNFGSEYTPVWVDNDDFNEIVISPTMGTDHFPNRICAEIESVASEYGIDISSGDSFSLTQPNEAVV